MSMTIGRCSITEDPDAGSLRQRGDEVSFSSVINAASVDEMKARVQQLRGLMDNDDETVFPFTWSEDSSFDGFYTDFNVEVSDYAAMLTTGACPFSLSMRRVGGFQRPRFEVITGTVVRTNSHAVTTPTVIRGAMPALTYWSNDRDIYNFGTAGLGGEITTEDGKVFVATGTVPFTTPDFYRFFVTPGDAYDGSARVELLYGATWYPIHGQQIPSDTAGNWRISNGFCRVYPSTVATGRFTVETYGSGSWVAAEMEVGVYAGAWGNIAATSNTSTFWTPVVLTNSLEAVTVRLPYGQGSFDFSLRRGDSWCELSIRSYNGATAQYGIGRAATTASTAFTGGIRATAGATRYLVATPATVSTDVVNGRAYLSVAASSATFAISADYLTGQITGDTAVRDAFLGARSESQRVVVR